jgi:hypothetical protein
VCDLGYADVGISEQGPRDIKIVVCQLWRAPSSAADAPGSG